MAGKNIPKLRFKDFNGGWISKSFAEVTQFINGKAYKQVELLNEGKYKVLRVGNLFSKSDWYYSDLELEEDKYVDNGDLMYAWSASFGPHFWRGPKTIYHYHIWKVIPSKNSDKQFLYYTFQVDLEKIKSQSQGGTMFHITKGNIEQRKFSFPALPEQQKIASFLSAIDEKVQQLTRKKELLEHYKKGVMQQLFSGKLRFKDENGKAYPKWEKIRLIDIASRNVKWSFTGGPFGSNLKSEEYTDSGVRILQLQNIGDGVFNDEYKIYTSEEKADELVSCNIYPGEILISKMGDPVARACRVPTGDRRYLMASDGIRFVPDSSRFSDDFIFQSINHPIFRNKALSLSTGSTRKRIGLTELKEILFSVPVLEEQQKIASYLSSLDSKIESVATQITQSQTFKKGLLQQMFV